MIAPHPHERPLRAAVIILSTLFWAGFACLLWNVWERYAPALSSVDIIFLAGAGAIVTYVGTWVRKAGRAVWLARYAVEIGPDQYPDLHARVRACVKRLGFAETPAAFLFHEPRDVLSYSLRYWARDYLALNGELVGALTDHQGAIDFFIGTELGRLHDPDRPVRWLLLPGRVFPLLGPAYARAKIYSYDRQGIGACRNRVDAALALALHASGSRRWKSFNIAHYAEQSLRKDPISDFFELVSNAPYLSRRVAYLRGVALGDSAHNQRHPLAWIAGALVPGIGPWDAAAIARATFALTWVALLTMTLWYSYAYLARAGIVEPIESRFENKVVPLASTATPTTPPPPPAKAVETDVYTRLDADLKRLGEIALTRQRKLGGIPCEVGNIAALDLNFRALRYALSCDEPMVYTVIEAGEFESGRNAHIRSYNWKEGRFSTSLPPVPTPATSGETGGENPSK